MVGIFAMCIQAIEPNMHGGVPKVFFLVREVKRTTNNYKAISTGIPNSGHPPSSS